MLVLPATLNAYWIPATALGTGDIDTKNAVSVSWKPPVGRLAARQFLNAL